MISWNHQIYWVSSDLSLLSVLGFQIWCKVPRTNLDSCAILLCGIELENFRLLPCTPKFIPLMPIKTRKYLAGDTKRANFYHCLASLFTWIENEVVKHYQVNFATILSISVILFHFLLNIFVHITSLFKITNLAFSAQPFLWILKVSNGVKAVRDLNYHKNTLLKNMLYAKVLKVQKLCRSSAEIVQKYCRRSAEVVQK